MEKNTKKNENVQKCYAVVVTAVHKRSFNVTRQQ